MTIDESIAQLKQAFPDIEMGSDGSVMTVKGEYLSGYAECIVLDGEFNVDQLKALVAYLELTREPIDWPAA